MLDPFRPGCHVGRSGSVDHLYLVVSDIEAARAELVGRGVEVGEIFHLLPGEDPKPGPDPERGTYQSYASFRDPDGNTWLLQEITTSSSGAMSNRENHLVDVATLAELLQRDCRAPRRVRSIHTQARLVGLVRAVPRRTFARQHA